MAMFNSYVSLQRVADQTGFYMSMHVKIGSL